MRPSKYGKIGRAALGLLSMAIAIAMLGSLTACGSADEDASAGQAATNVLRVGTEGTYSPYSYHDKDDVLTGYDIELVNAVGDKLNMEVEYTEMGFDGLAAGLDAGKFDIVADQICVTPERQEKYLFSSPYAYVRGVIIANEGNGDIASFDDLRGKKVALTVTSNWAKLAESYGAEIVSTGGFSESMQMVVDGRADATVNDNLVFLDYMGQHPDASVKIAASESEENVVAFLIAPGNDELRQRIDQALEELRSDGTMRDLSEKYFGDDVSVSKRN